MDVSGQRNAVGDIWWDKPIDELAGDWEVKVNHRSERLFFNRRTGEVTKKPPAGLLLIRQFLLSPLTDVHLLTSF